jgi:tryptophan 2,3-dioxygenase
MQITKNTTVTHANYLQFRNSNVKLTAQQMQQYNAVNSAINAAKQAAKRPPYYKQQQTTMQQLAQSIMRLTHDSRIGGSTKNVYITNMFNSYLQHVHNDNALLATIENNNCVS